MIIGLLAKKRHGKDTVADYLVEKYDFTKDAFANPIKEACGLLFGFSHEQLYGDLKEEIDPNWGITPRTVMQFVGTEVFRHDINKIIPNIGSNFWVNSFRARFNNSVKNNKNFKVVIADMRFPNEVDEIHKMGGLVIKIERSGISSSDEHESETSIDKIENYDILLENNGTLQDLYHKINVIMYNLKH